MVEHTTENRGVGGSIPPLTTTPTLVLLCAPSLGILDNWLPVLHAARASHPDWRIVALIPDRTTLAQLDPSDTAHVLADEVVDAAVVPLVDGSWIVADGLLGAVGDARPRRLRLGRATREQRARRVALPALAGPTNRLLYDVRLHAKERLRPILTAFGDTPRFSHNHGIELEVVDPDRIAPTDPEHVGAAFLYSADEVEPYAANFSLPRAALVPVGIARHEPDWVSHVQRRSSASHPTPFDAFVFVVSRPAGSPYLPRERKVAALRALRTVAWEEHGLPLVLRTHPKEHEDGTLAEALPAGEEGRSWVRSRAHPLHLASHSTVGVTFLSGVALDLVALGVPVIELLDVRGLAAYDTPDAPRDDRGRSLFGPYRRDGLVFPADGIEDLRATFTHVLADRDAAVRTLQTAMGSRFVRPTGATQRMLDALSA